MNSDATPPVSSDVTLTYAGWQVPRVPIVLPLQAPCISTFVSAPGGCPGVPRGHMSVPSGLGLFSSACRSEIWGQEAVGGPPGQLLPHGAGAYPGKPPPQQSPRNLCQELGWQGNTGMGCMEKRSYGTRGRPTPHPAGGPELIQRRFRRGDSPRDSHLAAPCSNQVTGP